MYSELSTRAVAGDTAIFGQGRIGFALDVASQLDRTAAETRYDASVIDAFASGPGGADAGGGRRRGGAYSADQLKQQQAQAMLDLGPDAVLMEWPEGHVPRQGQ